MLLSSLAATVSSQPLGPSSQSRQHQKIPAAKTSSLCYSSPARPLLILFFISFFFSCPVLDWNGKATLCWGENVFVTRLAVRTEAGSAAFLCHLCTSAPAETFGRGLLPPALAELLKFSAVNFSGFLCRDVTMLVTSQAIPADV